MTRYRVGVIGLGKQGWQADQDEGRPHPRSHVSAWQNCPRAEFWGGCDTNLSVVTPFRQFRLDGYAPGLDIVSVATPPDTHREIITACVSTGVRLIVCEKPLASTAQEAAAIVEACRVAGTPLLVNHGRRFHPLIRIVQQQVKARIGKPLWASAWTSGGLWENQIHMVDLLRFFLGDAGWVYATWKGPCGEQGENGYVMTLQFTSGAYAVIHAGDIRRYVQSDLHLFGERGSLHLLRYGLHVVWQGVDDQYPLAGGYSRLTLADMDSAPPTTFLREMTEHACDILEGTVAPWCSGEDGLAAVQVCEAAERSLAAGSMVIVPGST